MYNFLEEEGRIEQGTSKEATTVPFFAYTSNVDGHFHRIFQDNEIYEIHGSVEV